MNPRYPLVKAQLLVIALVATAFCVGCDRDDQVRAYQSPKEAPAPASDEAAADSRRLMEWTVPPGWKELPGDQMRYAAFAVAPNDPSVVLTVITASGDVLANVNRWEGQLGLPPTSASDLNKVVKRGTVTVQDFVRHVKVIVRAGHRYLARAGRRR